MLLGALAPDLLAAAVPQSAPCALPALTQIVESVAKSVSEPWKAANAAALDAETFQTWCGAGGSRRSWLAVTDSCLALDLLRWGQNCIS